MAKSTSNNHCISGIILAGGRATRMNGQDKGLLPLQGQPMAAHIASQLKQQCHKILINANRNIEKYAAYCDLVVRDELSNFQGPLAGMLSAMHKVSDDWMITVPCDGPFLAPDYVERMANSARAHNTLLAVACDSQRLQPVYTLLHVSLAQDLFEFLAQGERKIDAWFKQHTFCQVDFSDASQMFLNINTPQTLKDIEAQFDVLYCNMQKRN